MNPPGVAEIEAASLVTWPSIETLVDGAWRARFANGYTGRSNAIWVMDGADDSRLEERLDRLSLAYCARGLPPTVRVTPLMPEALVAIAVRRGWQAYGHSVVMARGALTDVAIDDAEVLPVPDRRWFDTKAALSELTADERATLSSLLTRMPAPAVGVLTRYADGTAAGAALVAVSGGVALYYNVVVHAARRGRGEGRRLMAAAMAWAHSAGATGHALQVAAENVAAIKLYESLGFKPLYPYHYLKAHA